MAMRPGDYVSNSIEEYVGRGRFQYLYVTGLCFTYGIAAIHTYSNIFASGAVTWHEACPSPPGSEPCPVVPLEAPANCSVPLELWQPDVPGASIVGEFRLVCSRRDELPELGSVYFMGYATGVVLCGNISDALGRRWAYLLGYILILAGGFLAPMAQSWATYAVARALLGAGVAGCGIVAFVWATEFLDTKLRRMMSWLPNVAFSLAQMAATPIAYYFPLWRHSLLACQLVSLIGLTYWCFLQESPRWLASVGRLDESHRVLCVMARSNGRGPPPSPPLGSPRGHLQQQELSESEMATSSTALSSEPEVGNWIFALCDRRLRLRFAVMCLNWFSIAFAFYGLSLFSPNLPLSVYFANVLSALVAIPFYLAAPVLVDAPWCGRRGAIASSYIFGGVLLTLSARCKLEWLSMTMYYVAYGALSLGFAVLYVWAAELFPTDIRTRCMSIQNVFARVGAALSPFVVDLGSSNTPLALCIVAAPCIISGALDFLLPETRGTTLPATIADIGAVGVDTSVPACRSEVA